MGSFKRLRNLWDKTDKGTSPRRGNRVIKEALLDVPRNSLVNRIPTFLEVIVLETIKTKGFIGFEVP